MNTSFIYRTVLCLALLMLVANAKAQYSFANCSTSELNAVQPPLDLALASLSHAADMRNFFSAANNGKYEFWFGPNVGSNKWNTFGKIYEMSYEAEDDFVYECGCAANVETAGRAAFALPGIRRVWLCSPFFEADLDIHQLAHILVHEISHGAVSSQDPDPGDFASANPDEVAEYVADNPAFAIRMAEAFAHYIHWAWFEPQYD